jgi:hypothetical protein
MKINPENHKNTPKAIVVVIVTRNRCYWVPIILVPVSDCSIPFSRHAPARSQIKLRFPTGEEERELRPGVAAATCGARFGGDDMSRQGRERHGAS